MSHIILKISDRSQMDLGHLIFDSSPSSSLASHKRSSDMLFLGTAGNSTAATSTNLFQGESGGRTTLRMDELIEFGGVNRRPFYSTPAELMLEDEYYDEQLWPEKKRRLTQEQVQHLEQSFEADKKLEPERKIELARKLGLQPRQVAVWFQNRRARWKSKQLERDFDRLKSSYDSLLLDHDSLVEDNQLLRSEVVALMEKLQSKNTTHDDHHHLNKLNDIPNNMEPMTVTIVPKVEEDHPSTGSGGSVVVDEEGPQPVVESSENYYPLPENGSFNDGYVNIFQSSEDDGSNNGGGGGWVNDRVEISDSTAVMERNNNLHQEEETSYFGLWMMWS